MELNSNSNDDNNKSLPNQVYKIGCSQEIRLIGCINGSVSKKKKIRVKF